MRERLARQELAPLFVDAELPLDVHVPRIHPHLCVCVCVCKCVCVCVCARARACVCAHDIDQIMQTATTPHDVDSAYLMFDAHVARKSGDVRGSAAQGHS